MKNVIYSKFSVKNEEDLMLIIDDSKYAIDDSNYSGSTAFRRYILLDEHLVPNLIVKFNRNNEKEEKVFKLFAKSIKNLKELYKHNNYVVEEKRGN